MFSFQVLATLPDERTGLQILKRALEALTRQIAENSSFDGGVVVDHMRNGKGNFGFDETDVNNCYLPGRWHSGRGGQALDKENGRQTAATASAVIRTLLRVIRRFPFNMPTHGIGWKKDAI